MEKSKKILPYIGVGIALIVLLVICFFIGGKDSSSPTTTSQSVEDTVTNAQNEVATISDEDRKSLEAIDIDKYLEFYQQPENKVVFIGRPTCGYCQIAHPIVEKINKDYDLNIYYLNTDDFVGDDESNFAKSNDYLSEGYGTPMLFVISNNEIVDMVDGLTDTSHYVEFLKKNGFISEE